MHIYTPKQRKLTQLQLRLPFFRYAKDRLSTISENRETLLPELNTHASGRATRAEVYRTLEKVAEQILVRIDLPTGTLGWADSRGRLRQSSQTQLAADSGVSLSVLSRLFARLEQSGYVKRRIKKLTKKESRFMWSVRTTTVITFTEKFFRHLGIHSAYTKARNWATKKRRAEIGLASAEGLLPGQQIEANERLAGRQRKRKAGFRRWINSQVQELEAQANRQRLKIQVEVLQQTGVNKLARDDLNNQVESILRERHPEYFALKIV